jgi:CRISPR/Cas system endoribonuclease Cas6 (RAMP superfamily)
MILIPILFFKMPGLSKSEKNLKVHDLLPDLKFLDKLKKNLAKDI